MRTATIYLYGEISEEIGENKVSSESIARELQWLNDDNDIDAIDIRVNSIGGEVYPGIAIFNAIRRATKPVTIFIDGIAASIAGVITQCGVRVEMSRYARLMLHNVSGGCFGNKNALKDMINTIESLEDTIAEIVSARCGMTKEEVAAKYFDGTDHWLRADEAKELGLVDAIYDVDPIPVDSDTDDIYKIFTNRLLFEQSQKREPMKLEDFKRIPRFANCASDEEVQRELEAVVAKAEQSETLEAENKELKNTLEQQTNERIDAVVGDAVKDGRLPADKVESMKNLLKSNYKEGVAILEAMKPTRLLRNELNDTNKDTVHESPWARRMAEINKMNGRV